MDDLKHFAYAPRDERAFGRNELVLGPRDSAFGRDYPRDVQMQNPHHSRGCASGYYHDRGGKCGRDEERGREKDRYTERDRNRNWQCDADSARDRDRDRDSDRDREYTQTWRPNKPFNHATELNNQILNNSYTIEHFSGRDGADRQKDRGKDRGEDRGRDGRDRNDRNNSKDRQYTLTERPSKQFDIELNKQVMRMTRESSVTLFQRMLQTLTTSIWPPLSAKS